MKSLLTAIFFVFSFTLLNAQNLNTAICNSKASLVKGVETGLIEITLPETVKKEEIEKYATYYTNAFVVNFNEKTHVASMKMVENTSLNRRVILRFLAANQVQNVAVEGKSFLMNDFYENFLK
jgi:hypothetical protein